MRTLIFYIVFILTLIPKSSDATHIVGGEIFYEHLGNGQYKIALIVYRDCLLGQAPFDSPANLTIYDGAGTFFKLEELFPISIAKLPSDIYDSCFSVPSGVCVERGFYETTLTLPLNASGYTVSWQRCCRNGSIKNIPNPGGWGSTITTHIPSRNSFANNSSPIFNNLPPLAICLGSDFKFDNSATDIDGDSLVYELCDVLHGADQVDPKPAQSTAPPYTKVTWGTGFSTQYPIDANPAFKIDSATGHLTGTPLQLGQYVFGICVSEYRNGVFVGMTRREYQINIKACISNTSASLFAPTKCNGLDLNFKNNSQRANSFFWDFGVPGVSTDTSSLKEGKFVFPDSGTYTIRLIANPGWGCADTAFKTITIYHGVQADIQSVDGHCITNPVFDFYAAGKFKSYTDIKWTFNGATPDSSSATNPAGIVYSDTGRYPITVRYEHKGCTSTITKYIIVYPSIKPQFFIRNNKGCTPLEVQLEDRTTALTPVHRIWTVDNKIYLDSIKRLTFTEPGEYVIGHQAFTTTGCKDTTSQQYKIIQVFSGPLAGFSISDQVVNIFDPMITVSDESYNRKSCTMFFGDELVTGDCNSSHSFTKPGKFKVSQIVSNDNGCTDTSSIYITVENEFAFFIPSTFTPNNDGKNEIFKPILVGVKEIDFTIFDRWGDIVFQTYELEVGWDGTLKNLEGPAPLGTYVYKVRVKDFLNEFHFYSDNVYLLR